MTYDAEVLADAPLIYWRLGESAGTATDSSGNTHTGTYSGSPTLGVTGLLVDDTDKAAQFHSATDDTLASAASFAPTTVTEFSIEAVVNISAFLVGAPTIFALCDPLGADPGFIDLQYDATNLSVYFQGTSGLYAAAEPFDFDTTYHLVGVFDGTDLRLYVNGVLAATTAALDAGAPVAIPFSWVAGNFGGGGFGTDGVVDECAFYDTALTADRVAAHYAAMLDPGPHTEGPTVRLVTSRALVVPHQIQRWILAIICKDHITTGPGDVIEQSQDVATIRDYFIGLRRTGTPVVYQEGDQRHLVVVRDVSFPEGQVERWGAGRNGLQGILMVTLDSTEA